MTLGTEYPTFVAILPHALEVDKHDAEDVAVFNAAAVQGVTAVIIAMGGREAAPDEIVQGLDIMVASQEYLPEFPQLTYAMSANQLETSLADVSHQVHDGAGPPTDYSNAYIGS